MSGVVYLDNEGILESLDSTVKDIKIDKILK